MIVFTRKDVSFESEYKLANESVGIGDDGYWKCLAHYGDGFYLDGALHIYGASDEYKFHDIHYRTNLVMSKFKNILNSANLICFGEDVFGNQFVTYDEGVGILMIESGEIRNISNDFQRWIVEVENELDYFTGYSFLLNWVKNHGNLAYDERLAPKIPFILGGKYSIDNIYAANFQKLIEFNAGIANQIYDMPDGTELEIDILP